MGYIGEKSEKMVMKKVAKNVTDSLSHFIFSKYNIVYPDPKVAYLAQKCPIYVIKDKSLLRELCHQCLAHLHTKQQVLQSPTLLQHWIYKKYTGG
jgi:hypothetical protein